MVGGEHDVAVVFYHQNRIAAVAEVFKRMNEAVVVALMQTNTRLVEDISDAHQLRADLCSEENTLAFAARQRSGGAVEAQIIQTHIEQKL